MSIYARCDVCQSHTIDYQCPGCMQKELAARRRDSVMLDFVLKYCSIIPDGTRPNLQSREEIAEAMKGKT